MIWHRRRLQHTNRVQCRLARPHLANLVHDDDREDKQDENYHRDNDIHQLVDTRRCVVADPAT